MSGGFRALFNKLIDQKVNLCGKSSSLCGGRCGSPFFAACGPKEYPAQGDCNLTVFQQERVRFCPDSIANYTAPTATE